MTRCLLIDPHAQARASLARYLESFAFAVRVGDSAQDLWRLTRAEAFDIVLLDLGPAEAGDEGLSLCRWVHEQLGLPLIAMVAAGDTERRVAALECGADDHIDRPHEPREVVARIRAVLRRLTRRKSWPAIDRAEAGVLAFAGWRLDPGARELRSASGAVVGLSAAELALLSTLAGRPRQVVDRVRLALSMGSAAQGGGRSVDLAISRLRHKLGDVPPHNQLIRTVRGEGYLLDAEVG